ncbi:MAG: hypothetical protein HIU93_16150 [Acidobacteria bacterium]|nr:hypothetical protein [Acidobacteriota bacterium]
MSRYFQLRHYIYFHLMMLIVLADGITKYLKHAATSAERNDIVLLIAVAVAIWVTFTFTQKSRTRTDSQENQYATPAAKLGMLGLAGVWFGLSAVMH